MDEFDIGGKLKQARQRRKMSMKELAREIGCSTSLISLIENRKISPPIKTLSGIAKALNMALADFFEEDEEHVALEIIRESETRTQNGEYLTGASAAAEQTQPCTPVKNKKMKPNFIRFPKGCSNYLKYLHSEESLVYVIHGKAELFIGRHTIRLEEGDSVYFETTAAHGFRSRDDSEVLILEVEMAA